MTNPVIFTDYSNEYQQIIYEYCKKYKFLVDSYCVKIIKQYLYYGCYKVSELIKYKYIECNGKTYAIYENKCEGYQIIDISRPTKIKIPENVIKYVNDSNFIILMRNDNYKLYVKYDDIDYNNGNYVNYYDFCLRDIILTKQRIWNFYNCHIPFSYYSKNNYINLYHYKSPIGSFFDWKSLTGESINKKYGENNTNGGIYINCNTESKHYGKIMINYCYEDNNFPRIELFDILYNNFDEYLKDKQEHDNIINKRKIRNIPINYYDDFYYWARRKYGFEIDYYYNDGGYKLFLENYNHC